MYKTIQARVNTVAIPTTGMYLPYPIPVYNFFCNIDEPCEELIHALLCHV